MKDVSVQWWMEWVRNRPRDRARSLETVNSLAASALRGRLAEYDAFAEEPTVTEGLLLGSAWTSGGREVRIRLPWGKEHAHWLVQGGTGTGKTTWIAWILRQELEAGRPFGLIDCKGDLFDMTLRWTAALGRDMPSRERDELRKRVVVINPFSETLIPFNVCRPLPGASAEVHACEVALALSRLFESSLGIHMENILRHLLLLLIEFRLSLLEAPLVLQDDVVRGILATRSGNPAVRAFFLGTYSSVPQASKDALLARLQGFLFPENLRLMLGAETIVDFHGIVERGDPLFVFLGRGPGVPEEQIEVMGSLLLQLFFQAVYARGTGARSRYLLAVDEFFHLLEAPGLTRRFETALTTARSFGLALMLIHHNFAQLPKGLREIILGNCDLVALFRTSVRNAEVFGDFLPSVDPELAATHSGEGTTRDQVRRYQLEALQRLPDRTYFWYDRRRPHRAIRMGVPDVGEQRHGGTQVIRDRAEWGTGAFALSREQLRREFEERQERLRALVRPTRGSDVRRANEPAQGMRSSKTRTKRPRLG